MIVRKGQSTDAIVEKKLSLFRVVTEEGLEDAILIEITERNLSDLDLASAYIDQEAMMPHGLW